MLHAILNNSTSTLVARKLFYNLTIPFLYLLLSLLFISACHLDTKKTGMAKRSQSIQESMNNGVFKYELYVDNPLISIGDKKFDTVKQAWVEYKWQYKRENGRTVIKKDTIQQVLLLMAQLSERPVDTVLLKQNGSYFGWNGVLFSTYEADNNKIFVVKKINNHETIIDTLILNK